MKKIIQDVNKLLKQAGIKKTAFGKDKYVPIEYLYKEIAAGETTLKIIDGKIHRYIAIVSAEITYPKHPKQAYREVAKTYTDGRKITKNSNPAEKMFAWEKPAQTLKRLLNEEIKLKPKEYTFKIITKPKHEYRKNNSYPGFQTHYIKYYAKVKLKHDIINQNYLDQGEILKFNWRKR